MAGKTDKPPAPEKPKIPREAQLLARGAWAFDRTGEPEVAWETISPWYRERQELRMVNAIQHLADCGYKIVRA